MRAARSSARVVKFTKERERLSGPAAAVMVTISAAATDCIASHHHLIGMSERHAQRSKAVPTAWLAVSLGLAYLAADIVLNKLALGDGWQIFWPLNGITIATLIMRSRAQWSVLLLGVSVGTGLGEFLDG